MLPDTGIDDVKKQRNAEYAKHINDPVLSSLKMEGIRLILFAETSKNGERNLLATRQVNAEVRLCLF
jgi:hypothetical protein